MLDLFDDLRLGRASADCSEHHRRPERRAGLSARCAAWARWRPTRSAPCCATFRTRCASTWQGTAPRACVPPDLDRSGMIDGCGRRARPTSVLSVTVDGQPVEVPAGASALDAINAAGVYSRSCARTLTRRRAARAAPAWSRSTACAAFPPRAPRRAPIGMQISVDSPEAQRIRRGVIELTMAMHPDACQTNRPSTHNDVVDAARAHGIDDAALCAAARSVGRHQQPVLHRSTCSSASCALAASPPATRSSTSAPSRCSAAAAR